MTKETKLGGTPFEVMCTECGEKFFLPYPVENAKCSVCGFAPEKKEDPDDDKFSELDEEAVNKIRENNALLTRIFDRFCQDSLVMKEGVETIEAFLFARDKGAIIISNCTKDYYAYQAGEIVWLDKERDSVWTSSGSIGMGVLHDTWTVIIKKEE